MGWLFSFWSLTIQPPVLSIFQTLLPNPAKSGMEPYGTPSYLVFSIPMFSWIIVWSPKFFWFSWFHIPTFDGWTIQWIGLREWQEPPHFYDFLWGNPWFPADFLSPTPSPHHRRRCRCLIPSRPTRWLRTSMTCRWERKPGNDGEHIMELPSFSKPTVDPFFKCF